MKKKFFKDLKKPFLIAEISANHNGSIENCLKLIKVAKENGADAVKLQTYNPQAMTLKSKRKEFLIKEGLWKNYTLWNLFSKAQTPYDWHKKIFEYAKKLKINCFSSAFDKTSVDLLEKLNCPFYKIASFEITDYSLIDKVAKTKKPIIISTGLSKFNEIVETVNFAKKRGASEIAILYCVSSYPARDDEFNLRNISILKEKFNCEIGFSDHSNNIEIAKLAYSLGATIFEKHIALNNQKKGFDIKFSLKGKEIKYFKNELIKVKKLLGKNNFERKKSELKNLKFRRSIYAIKDILKGEKFTENNIKSIRPANGLDPRLFFKVLNKKSKKKIKSGTPLNKNHY